MNEYRHYQFNSDEALKLLFFDKQLSELDREHRMKKLSIGPLLIVNKLNKSLKTGSVRLLLWPADKAKPSMVKFLVRYDYSKQRQALKMVLNQANEDKAVYRNQSIYQTRDNHIAGKFAFKMPI